MSLLTRLSLANRLVVALLALVIVVVGVYTAFSLKQELIPDTTAPGATITATYAGASPQIVADEVADPIEQAVSAVTDVTKVSSTSSTGTSQISVEWDYGKDDDKVLSDISNAINGIESDLPDDVTTNITQGMGSDIPVVQLAVASDLPLSKLGPVVQDRVVDKLESIEGVREVQVTGEDTTRIEIVLNNTKLDKYDLTATSVTQTVQGKLSTIPAGTSYDGDTALSIEVGTEPDTLKKVAALTVATEDYGSKRLDQLGTVKVATVDRTSVSRADGRPSLGLSVLKTDDADSVEVASAVAALTPELTKDIGNNASFTTVFDQSPLIKESLHDLATEGGLGLGFAVLIILVFLLSVRSTLITAISIPVSLLIALIGLWAADFSLNLLTLAALTVAVGRVVDDSIVVIENVKRRTAHTYRPSKDDIVAAVKEVGGAVTASTLTTVAVFVPVATVSGSTGQLFRPFAITVVIALVASLFVALTIVPLLAFWFMRGKPADVGDELAGQREAQQVTRLQRGYLPLLKFSLKHPAIVLGLATVMLVGTLGAATLLKTDFLGSFGDDRSLTVTQTLPVGTRLEASSKTSEKVEADLKANADIKNFQATIGQAGSPNIVTYAITLSDTVDTAAATDRLRSQLAETTDGGDIKLEAGSASLSSNDLTVTLTGDDEKTLRTASDDLLAQVKQVPQLTDVSSNLADERPILRVQINDRRASELGFTETEISDAVSTAVQGVKAGEVTLGSDSTDVYVKTYGSDATPKQVAALKIPVSTLQQQKAVDKANDALDERSDELSDRSDALSDKQDDLSDRQTAASDKQQDDSNADAEDSYSDLRDSRSDAKKAVSKAKKALKAAKSTDLPDKPAAGAPGTPVTAEQLAYDKAVEAKQSAIAQAESGVDQAEDSVDSLDDQVSDTKDSLAKTARQQAQSDEFTKEQDALTAEQDQLADDQEALSDDQADIADLEARPITVGDVAKVKVEDEASSVQRKDNKQAVTITGTPTGSDLGSVSAELKAKVASFHAPDGVEVVVGGSSADQNTAFTQLGLAMLLAIALVFIIMVATFKSLVQPLILLVAIPFAATGALVALLVTDTPLGVSALIGLLMLIGIVVTNAIVLIDLINTYRERGADPLTAIIDGARLRLRPIIMTAAATVFALLPMGLGLTGGGGGFIGKPLSVVVVGGLVSSTVLTLLLVPLLYGLVARVAGKTARAQLAGVPAARTGEDEDEMSTVVR